MSTEFTCTLHMVRYDSNEAIPMEQRTPVEMDGEFQYIGEQIIYFSAFFEPMGGVWVWKTDQNGKTLKDKKLTRYVEQEIGDAAMAIACQNRTAVEPEDFTWTYTKKVVEEWS